MGDVILLPIARVERDVDLPCDVENVGADEPIYCGIDLGSEPAKSDARMFMKVDTPQGPRFVEVFSSI